MVAQGFQGVSKCSRNTGGVEISKFTCQSSLYEKILLWRIILVDFNLAKSWWMRICGVDQTASKQTYQVVLFLLSLILELKHLIIHIHTAGSSLGFIFGYTVLYCNTEV